MLDNFHRYPVEQNDSDCWQTIHYVVYRLPTIADILFYWITMKVIQSYLTLGRPNGPTYLTGELLNTPLTTRDRADLFLSVSESKTD